jgi:hypothetical protein
LAQHTISADAPIYSWAGIDEAIYEYVSDFQRGGWFTAVRQGRFPYTRSWALQIVGVNW